MRRLINASIIALTVLVGTGFAQTKVYLRSTAGTIKYGASFRTLQATSSAGTLSTPAQTTTNTVAGPVTQQFWPSLAAGVFPTDVAAGTKTIWISDPLSAGVTISGKITPNIWAVEDAAAANTGIRLEVLRWSKKEGGIVSSLGITTRTSNELASNNPASITAPQLTPTSTVFQAGDRFVIIVYGDDAKSKTMAASHTWNIFYDGNSVGASGDTYVSFTETFTFAADTNNARSVPGNN